MLTAIDEGEEEEEGGGRCRKSHESKNLICKTNLTVHVRSAYRSTTSPRRIGHSRFIIYTQNLCLLLWQLLMGSRPSRNELTSSKVWIRKRFSSEEFIWRGRLNPAQNLYYIYYVDKAVDGITFDVQLFLFLKTKRSPAWPKLIPQSFAKIIKDLK